MAERDSRDLVIADQADDLLEWESIAGSYRALAQVLLAELAEKDLVLQRALNTVRHLRVALFGDSRGSENVHDEEPTS